MVYRDTPLEASVPEAAPGLVTDMVRQFADPYAFLRELVQNGIDAGATRIDVRVEHDANGVMLTSVTDDGAGMSRAVIEGPLLSLFQSSKEKDATKIGKYGVGFVSVFAVAPSLVTVETRTAAEAWLVRLTPDHAYELVAPRVPLERPGTRVTVRKRLDGAAAVEHAARCLAALKTWCRHAHVPICFTTAADTQTINVPFGVPGALVSVIVGVADARIAVGVGRASLAASVPFSSTGFYNRGLTLLETTAAEHAGLEGLQVKIESPRLAHTISRDAVKRDRELDDLVADVSGIVADRLWPALVERAKVLATTLAATPTDADALFAYGEVLNVARLPVLARVSGIGKLAVPLLAPVAGRSTRLVKGLGEPVWTATERTPLVDALAERGIPVVAASVAQGDLGIVVAADATWSLVRCHELEPGDEALLRDVRQLLGELGIRAGSAVIAVYSGNKPVRGFRRVTASVLADGVLRAESVSDEPTGRSAVLVLDAEDAAVRLARRRARTDPALAAQLLARAFLLRAGPLEPASVDRLLELAAGE